MLEKTLTSMEEHKGQYVRHSLQFSNRCYEIRQLGLVTHLDSPVSTDHRK